MLVAVVHHPTSTGRGGALPDSYAIWSSGCRPLASNGFVVSECRLAQSKEGVVVRVVNAPSQGRRAHT